MFRLRFTDEFLVGKPSNTQSSYNAALNHWERLVGPVRSLDSITPSLVSQFSGRLAGEVSQVTVSTHLRHLRAAFRWAESMEMLSRAPRFVMPRQSKRRLARSRAITEDEYRAIREAVAAVKIGQEVESWRRFVELLWLSGLRIGEALQLSWDKPPIRVDLEAGKFPRLVIWGEGQKSRDDQTAVITPEFAEWLRKTPSDQRKGPVASGLAKVTRTMASHAVSDFGRAAKIETSPGKPASAHDFRRAFGQRWAAKVKPLTLQRMMRHASISTTLAYYVDLGDEDVGAELWG